MARTAKADFRQIWVKFSEKMKKLGKDYFRIQLSLKILEIFKEMLYNNFEKAVVKQQ